MFRRNWLTHGAIAMAFIVAAATTGLLWPDQKEKASADSTPPTTVAGEECIQEDIVREILLSAGWDETQFVIGEDNIDPDLPAARDAGNGAFTTEAYFSAEEWTNWVTGGSEPAEAVLEVAIEPIGGTKEMAGDPGNWVAFQLLTESYWSGNTLFIDGNVTPAGTRHSAIGDVGWMFIHPEDCATRANLIRTALVRVGCGNPQTTIPTPQPEPDPNPVQVCRPGVGVVTIREDQVRPDDLPVNDPACQPPPEEGVVQVCRPGTGVITIPESQVRSTDRPPGDPACQPPPQCPPDMPHGTWPVCKDSPENDPGNTGNVPPQVTGTAPPVTEPASPTTTIPPPR